MPLRILIVDDHALVRNGLRSLLSAHPEWTVCGEAVDGVEAVEKAKTLRPDLILMDISMPRMDGLEATRAILKELPEAKVIILSQNDPVVVRQQAAQVKAHGYVKKTDLPRDLEAAIEKVIGRRDSVHPPQPEAGAGKPYQPWANASGEMAERIAQKNWAETPIGPVETWSPTLRVMVSFLLANRFPLLLWWGPQYTQIYNDAYVPIPGTKHPQALGQPAHECWPEIWQVIQPLIDTPFHGGPATWMEDLELEVHRSRMTEETHFTVAYSPVPDETAPTGIGGVLATVHEITEKIVGERRVAILRDLGTGAAHAKTTEQACSMAAEVLCKHPKDFPFALLYLMDADGTSARLICSARLAAGGPGSPSVIPLKSIPLKGDPAASEVWPLSQVMRTQDLVLTDDLAGRFEGNVPLGAWSAPPEQAAIVPIRSSLANQLAGFFIAGISPRLKFDEAYRSFLDLAARQIATSVATARAYEEERKRAEALAEIDRAKTAFFSNVSHEFRTPLTLMLGPVEDLLAKSHVGLSPAAKGQLELVSRNGTRLLRLVNTLLDFSRIEAGRMQAIYQPTDLAAFTKELASGFRSATEKAGLHLELDCPPLEKPVFVDRGMWEKIVLNLISNAFKFTFEGGIAVTLARSGKNAELRVRDTGVGIPPKEVPRLFDRFHRIENTRSRTHEGSGIGLALVQELVKLHGGTVRVESMVGKGSTFIVSLPLGSAHLPADRIGKTRTLASTAMGAAPYVEEALRWLPDAEPASIHEELLPGHELLPVPCPPGPAAETPTEKRPLILLADDNADMRQYLVRLLAERYEVQAVPDGQAALAAMEQRIPDLVLTDVMMPHLDGFGLVDALRKNPHTRTIPVILLSARAGEESRVEGMEHGADDYLIKPFSSRELLARVQTHLEMARVRRLGAEALLESEGRATRILESIADGFMAIDRNWRITYVNPRAEKLFERLQKNKAGLVGKIFWEEFPDTVGTPFESNYRRAVSENVTVTFEAFYPALQRWFDVRAYPSSAGLSLYVLDVTDRKQSEQIIRQHRERFELVAQASQIGFWFCDLPFSKLIWDTKVKEHFWLPPEDEITIEMFYERLHPDDLERTRQAMAESIASDLPYDIDYRTVGPDGREKWIRAMGRAFYDAAGRPQSFDGLTLDITERKQAEARERQITAEAVAATAKFRAVFEQTSVFAGIMDVDGIVLDANRLSLEACGYRPEEVLGKPFWETGWWRLSADAQAKVKEATKQAAQGHAYEEILSYHWADGTERLVNFALHPIRDDRGHILFLHPTGVDITDLKRAEENYRTLALTLNAEVRARTNELEQRNVEVMKQSDLLRSLSRRLMQAQDEERRRIARDLHDSAGQILAALGMNLAFVAKKARQNAPELAKGAEDSQELVQQLSQEIRTLSYLLHPPLLDESGLSEALRWYIQGLMERSGLSIHLNVPEDFGRLPRDLELVMFRLVQECLTNIHRHSASKNAEIRLARENAQILLEVQDDGKGMSAEELAEIQSGGAGVGIRGMRERVRQFDGHMNIESGADGTKISFLIPVAETIIPKSEAEVQRVEAVG